MERRQHHHHRGNRQTSAAAAGGGGGRGRHFHNPAAEQPLPPSITVADLQRFEGRLLRFVERWSGAVCDYHVNCEDLAGGFGTRLRRRGYAVYTGLPGAAYMYWYLWRRWGREEHGEWCMRLGGTAVEMMRRRLALRGGGGRQHTPEHGELDEEEEEEEGERRLRMDEADCTFLCGWAGTCAIMAVAYQQIRRDSGGAREMVRLLERMGRIIVARSRRVAGASNELMYGRAGWVYAAQFVNSQQQQQQHTVSRHLVDAVVELILRDGRRHSAHTKQQQRQHDEEGPPLMWQWRGREYLGGAHGVTGILRVLADWQQQQQQQQGTGDKQRERLARESERTMRWLHDHCRTGGGAYVTRAHGTNSDLVQWCHGSPSVCMLLADAYVRSRCRQRDLLAWAEDAARDIWRRGLLRKGVGLCHGIAGNGYAFLKLHEATADDKYLAMCISFAQFAMDHMDQLVRVPDWPYSLFEGVAGCVVWMVDIVGAIRRHTGRSGHLSVFPSWDLMR